MDVLGRTNSSIVPDLIIPIFTFASLLTLNTFRELTEHDYIPTDFILDNDPKCGVTTGGRNECDWDCEQKLNFADVLDITFTDTNRAVPVNPECLVDCFTVNQCFSGIFR